MNSGRFKSEKQSRTASIVLNTDIEKAYSLFGAFEERKWVKGWDPELIYPYTEIIEEGTTFKTKPGTGYEAEFLWRVTKYEPGAHLVQYLISTENRYWTVTVKCISLESSQTAATITYTYIGLNEKGNELNKQSLDSMYRENLKDWEIAINSYLEMLQQ